MYKKILLSLVVLLSLFTLNTFAQTTCPNFQNNFTYGATDRTTNGEVSKLQLFLKSINPRIIPTGGFGNLSSYALYLYQKQNNLISPNKIFRARSTYFDQATKNLINSCGSNISGNNLEVKTYPTNSNSTNFIILPQVSTSTIQVMTPSTPQATPVVIVSPQLSPKESFYSDLYKCILEREPEQGILGNVLASTEQKTLLNIFSNFFLSQEYTNKNKSDSQYVTQLYKCILKRNSSESEINGWSNGLKAGQARASFIPLFISSSEFRTGVGKSISDATGYSLNVGSQNVQTTINNLQADIIKPQTLARLNPLSTEVQISGLYDTYAPFVYKNNNGEKKMAMGGWKIISDRDNYLKELQLNSPSNIYGPDKIFQSKFNNGIWTEPTLVFKKIGYHVNDPTIVKPPSSDGVDRSNWLYMFMTGLPNTIAAGPASGWGPGHEVVLATSVDGGETWSDVGTIIYANQAGDGKGAWSPSAILSPNQDEIWIYYHTGTTDFSRPITWRQRISLNGISKIGSPERLSFSDPNFNPVLLANLDVSKVGSKYVLLGTKLGDSFYQKFQIYFSDDGMNWYPPTNFINPIIDGVNHALETPSAEWIGNTLKIYFGYKTVGDTVHDIHAWTFNVLQ